MLFFFRLAFGKHFFVSLQEMNELENKSRKRKYQNNDNDDSLRDNKSGKKKFKKKFKQK